MSNEHDEYQGIILEQMHDQNRAVLEAVADIRGAVANLPTRSEFEELQADVRTIRLVVTDMGHTQQVFDQQLSRIVTAINS